MEKANIETPLDCQEDGSWEEKKELIGWLIFSREIIVVYNKDGDYKWKINWDNFHGSEDEKFELEKSLAAISEDDLDRYVDEEYQPDFPANVQEASDIVQ